MKIIPADISQLELVQGIVQKTISAVYPHYYPAGAVKFFLHHHCTENIRCDLEAGRIWLLEAENSTTGTVTLKGNEICRLFVLPEYQARGYGRALMDFAEKTIAGQYPEIRLDASFPAKAIYLRRGYQPISYHTVKTENGDFLCYDEMIKHI